VLQSGSTLQMDGVYRGIETRGRQASVAGGLRPPHAVKTRRAPVITRNSDNWTIDRWRLERRFNAFEFDDPPGVEQVPTLWKDLTLVLVVAVVFWVTAAVLVG
jgi:hypothetical protein